MRRVPSALLLCCWLLVGCSSDRDAMEKRLGSLREDITRLQADNDRLGERVGRLEVTSTPALAPTAGAAQAAADQPASTAKLERPPLKVIRLVPHDAPAVSTGVASGDVTADERPDAPGTRPLIRLRGKADSREEGSSAPAVARRSSASSQEEP